MLRRMATCGKQAPEPPWGRIAGVTGELRAIRTDVVGSLLRPQAWLEARQGFDDQRISLDALREIELTCVRELIALQESVGLDVVTDGEISRLNFRTALGSPSVASMQRPKHCMCTNVAQQAEHR